MQLHDDNLNTIEEQGVTIPSKLTTNGAAFEIAKTLTRLEAETPDEVYGNIQSERNYNTAFYAGLNVILSGIRSGWQSTWTLLGPASRILGQMKALGLQSDSLYALLLDRCSESWALNNHVIETNYRLPANNWSGPLTPKTASDPRWSTGPFALSSIKIPVFAALTTDPTKIDADKASRRANIWQNWRKLTASDDESQNGLGYLRKQFKAASDWLAANDPTNADAANWFKQRLAEIEQHFKPLLDVDESTVPK